MCVGRLKDDTSDLLLGSLPFSRGVSESMVPQLLLGMTSLLLIVLMPKLAQLVVYHGAGRGENISLRIKGFESWRRRVLKPWDLDCWLS